jgi:hypothetical protein
MTYELIILVYLVAASWLALKTHRFKSPIVRWALIVLLPLSLLGYAKLPIDIFTILLFAPLLIAAVWSLVSIVLLGIKLVTSTPRPWTHVATHAIRPLLCLIVFGTVRYLHDHSLQLARLQAAQTAIGIQEVCKKEGRCPTSLQNWQRSQSSGNNWVARLGSPLATTYLAKCELHDQTYSIMLRINIDQYFEVTGGVHLPFEVYRGPYIDHEKLSFNQAEKLLAHVSKLQR